MEGDFRIGPWLVQPLLNTLSGPDQCSTRVETKVMEVLVFLANRAGEVLPKERIIQAIWKGTFVTDDVLTGAISDLRHALRDDPKSPKYIQTIPKRGYRLIAPVVKGRVLQMEIEGREETRLSAPPPVPMSGSSVNKGGWLHRNLKIAVFLLAAVAGTSVLMRIIMVRLTENATRRSHLHSQISVDPADHLTGFTTQDEISFASQPPSRTSMSLSPDGNSLVISAAKGGISRLYLKLLKESSGFKPLPGTEGGAAPFFSPDGSRVAFWVGSALRVVTITGEMPMTICDSIGDEPYGADWTSNDAIIFAQKTGGIRRISTTSGKIEDVTHPNPERGEKSHRLPRALPDDRGILFTSITSADWGQGSWRAPEIGLQGSKSAGWQIIIQDAADARYVSDGYILFVREGTLMAVLFDLSRLRIKGHETVVALEVMQANASYGRLSTGAAQYAVSNTGILVYASEGPKNISLQASPVTYLHLLLNWRDELGTIAVKQR